MNMKRRIISCAFVVTMLGVSFAAPSGVQANIIANVSAGTAFALEGDDIVLDTTPGSNAFKFRNTNFDVGFVDVVLDLGSVKTVELIHNINANFATNSAMNTVQVLVAADESAVGFDSSLVSSYGVEVFADGAIGLGDLGHNAANSNRTIDIVDSTKQYFLLRYTSNFLPNSFSASGGQGFVADLDVTLGAVPEPASVALLGAGGCLMMMRRKENVQ